MNARRLIAALALLGVVLAGCGGSATAEIVRVPAAEAAQVLEDQASGVVLLDIRTPEEYNDARSRLL